MMETLLQPYSPHLKKVLKKYQLCALKSLQGPSVVLGPSAKTEAARESEPEPEPFPPPPFPIQQVPILSEADSRGERCDTVLEGEAISCFLVGGERRLCLPQILNTVLRDFSLSQINQVCDDLQIFCSRCNPEQLEELKVTGILPATAPSCGLITKTDAERLCSALLHHGAVSTLERCGGTSPYPTFQVYHECFGKCRGLVTPALYVSPIARCIECLECRHLFSPQHFVCHAHRPLQNRTCHWGFDSMNWRCYLLATRNQDDYESVVKMLGYLKEKEFPAAEPTKRKSPPTKESSSPGLADIDSSEVPGKKAKTEDVSPLAIELTRSHNGKVDLDEETAILKIDDVSMKEFEDYRTYLRYAEPYLCWYESWRTSAFRPWPSLPVKDGRGQPIIRDSVPQSVPAFLSRGPPILLHPDRVVPLSETERFERSFQPNVALAPAPHHRPKVESSETQVKCEPENDSVSINRAGAGATYNPEIELSTDTDDSCSEAAGDRREQRVDRHHHREHGQIDSGERVVQQVAEVLDALSDAKEATRARVVSLVKQLASRLEVEEASVRQLDEENTELRRVILEQADHIAEQDRRIAHLVRKINRPESPPKLEKSTLAVEAPPMQTSCSPVSVITSSPGLVIKTEPSE